MTFIYSVIAAVFPNRMIGKLISRGYSKTLFRILLFLFGIFNPHEQPTALVDTYSEVEEIEEPAGGDIIIANFASYINLFWLQCKYSPIFVIPVDSENVVVKTVHQLMFQIIGRANLLRGVKRRFSDVYNHAKKNRIPLVVFPEAAVTNGKCLIKFQDFGIGTDISSSKIHILGFVHWQYIISPNYIHGNGFLHFMMMLGRLFGGLKIKVGLPQDMPKPKNGKIDAAFIERAQYVLSTIMDVSVIDACANDYYKVHHE